MARGAKKAAVEAGPVEAPWELPEGWRWERLGDLCSFVSRGRGPKYVEMGGVRVFNQRCVRWRGLDHQHCKLTSSEAAARLPVEQHLRNGDILWNSTGTGTIGRAAIYRQIDSDPAVADSHLTIVRLRNADPEWVCHWISTLWVQQAVAGTGSTNQVELARQSVIDLAVPVPPRGMEPQILSRITELFGEIGDGDAAVATARLGVSSYQKALLKAATLGELTLAWRLSNSDLPALDATMASGAPGLHQKGVSVDLGDLDESDLPALPDGWRWAHLGELGKVSGGLTQNAKREALPDQVRFLRVANVYSGRLDLGEVELIGVQPGELGRALLEPGDLLIVEGNGSLSQIGRSAVWDGSISPCAHQNHLIKVRFVEPEMGVWVQAWLQSPHGRVELEQRASSTSGLHTLSISKVNRLRCPVPPTEERAAAIAAMTAYRQHEREATSVLEAAASAGQSLRQSILTAAFRGDLVA